MPDSGMTGGARMGLGGPRRRVFWDLMEIGMNDFNRETGMEELNLN